MTTRQFEVYAPLQDFCWNGDDFALTPGLRMRRFNPDEKPDLRGLDATLAEDERTDAFSSRHWLTFRWNEGDVPCPAETVNLALVALWLVKPTRSHVAFRFELGHEAAAAEKGRFRLFDRFAWVPGATHDEFEDSDLQSVSSHYPALRDICCAGGRLSNALMLTLAGCWSHHWQPALICHAAAAEAILTYATGPGITNRLATSYACLVETQANARDAAFIEFRELYSVRSDIMHGRTHKVPESERLPILARFQGTLRTLWGYVLSSPQLITVLDGTDSLREAWFLSLQCGYTPPQRRDR